MANKNIFANNFSEKADVPRDHFDLSHYNNITCKFGKVYPILCHEVPAGSTYKIKPNFGFELLPLAFPTQTNIRCNMAFYKIPFRILWKNYEDFVSRQGSHEMPFISRSENWCKTGSLADYLGLPTGTTLPIHSAVTSPSDLSDFFPFQGYCPTSPFQSSDNGTPYFLKTYLSHNTNHNPNGYFYHLTFPSNYPIDADDPIVYMQVLLPHPSTVATSFPNFQFGFTCQDFTSDEIDMSENHTQFTTFDNIGLLSSADLSTLNEGEYCFISEQYGMPLQNTALNFSSSFISMPPMSMATIALRLPSSMVTAFNACIANNLHPRFCHVWTANPTTVADGVNSILFGTYLNPSTPIHGTYQDNKDNTYHFTFSQGHLEDYISYNAVQYGIEDSSPFVGENPRQPINALPFRAYEFIHNYRFRNSNIDPFIKDGQPSYNEYLTNDGDGADSTTPVELFDCLYETDYFSTCLKSPQMGNAPLVGITAIPDADGSTRTQQFLFKDENEDEYTADVVTDDEHRIVGISKVSDNANESTITHLKELIPFGVSINDFRNVNCFQKFLEKYERSGYRYENIMRSFFGTTPPTGDHYPEFVGGLERMVSVGKVVNTAKSNDFALGQFAGSAHVNSTGDIPTISCYCNEQSYIMGVMWFSVTPTYSQMLPKHFIKFDLLDYYNPTFNRIGLQPVYKKELTPCELSVEDFNDVFGYQRPFAEYVSAQDTVHGLFRSNLANFILQRVFGSAPSLGHDFVTMDSADLTNIFSSTSNDDKIYGQIWFDIDAILPMPRILRPGID